MTLNELQKWMLGNDVPDSWWVAIDGEVMDNLMTLPDVSKTKDQHPAALVAVLHESLAAEEEPEWIPFHKEEGARFKVVSSRLDGVQVNVPKAAKQAAEDKNNEVQKATEAAAKEIAAAQEAEHKASEKEAKKKNGFKKKFKSSEVEVVLPDTVKEEMAAMSEEIANLRSELTSLQNLAEELKRPILEAHKVLEEREQFLEVSESNLFDKAQKQEVMQTELEQLREDLEDRESSLRVREAALQA